MFNADLSAAAEYDDPQIMIKFDYISRCKEAFGHIWASP